MDDSPVGKSGTSGKNIRPERPGGMNSRLGVNHCSTRKNIILGASLRGAEETH
jgi:hypothetical protein